MVGPDNLSNDCPMSREGEGRLRINRNIISPRAVRSSACEVAPPISPLIALHLVQYYHY